LLCLAGPVLGHTVGHRRARHDRAKLLVIHQALGALRADVQANVQRHFLLFWSAAPRTLASMKERNWRHLQTALRKQLIGRRQSSRFLLGDVAPKLKLKM
jgi:hypothetical protein